MNLKKIIVPIFAAVLFSSCSSNSGSSKKKDPDPTPTPEPVVPLPTYDPYDPSTAGVAPKHLTSFDIDLKNTMFGKVGDTFTITPKFNGSKNPAVLPDIEKTASYEIANPKLIEGTQVERQFTFTLKEPGTTTITAYSWEKRFSRTLTMNIYNNDDYTDIFSPDYSKTKAKTAARKMFGWIKNIKDKGDSDGIALMGRQSWVYHRDNPQKVAATIGDGITFGTSSAPEGAMSLKTHFNHPVKGITFYIATAPETIQTSYGSGKSDYGSSYLTASMDSKELSRTVGGIVYRAGQLCHTNKGTDDAPVSPHYIDCENLSGDFSFNLSASAGYVHLKSIIIEYSNIEKPQGNETTESIVFNNAIWSDDLLKSPRERSCRNSSATLRADFNMVRQPDETVGNYVAMRGLSEMTLRPYDVYQSIKSVKFTVKQQTPTEGDPVAISLDFYESYSGGMQNIYTRSTTGEETTFEVYGDGIRSVTIKNTAKATTLLGLVSIEAVLTDVYGKVIGNDIQINGILKTTEYYEGQMFSSDGTLIIADYGSMGSTGYKYNPIQIVDSGVEWDSLKVGDTSISGYLLGFDPIVFTGLTVTKYDGLKWRKATNYAIGKKYIFATVDGKIMLNGQASSDEVKKGTANVSTVVDEEGKMFGSLTVDSGYFTFKEGQKVHYRVQSQKSDAMYYLNVLSDGSLSLTKTAGRYFDFNITDNGVELLDCGKNQTTEPELDHLFGVSTDEPYNFKFVDMSPEQPEPEEGEEEAEPIEVDEPIIAVLWEEDI